MGLIHVAKDRGEGWGGIVWNELWGCIQCEDFVDLLRAGRLCCRELVGWLIGCLVSWLGR